MKIENVGLSLIVTRGVSRTSQGRVGLGLVRICQHFFVIGLARYVLIPN